MSANGAALSVQDAVIYLMVMASASDGHIPDQEYRTIGRVVRSFPLFSKNDENRLVQTAEAAGAAMSAEGGLMAVLDAAAASIPPHLAETAYAAIVDVVTADEVLSGPEIRIMELICTALKVSDEGASAIERAARARHMTEEKPV